VTLRVVNKPFAKAKAIADRFRALGEAGDRPRSRLLGTHKNGAPQSKSEQVGELFIYETIGFDWWSGGGITGQSVKEALDAMEGVKTLNIYINSEGGDVFEASAIFTHLKRFAAEKVVHVDGIAASAATFIAMAGDKIITSPVATWMVHQAWTMAMGRAEDLRATADLLDLLNQTIAETYAARTGGTVEEMLALMGAPPDGTWMNAASALELGFTDEIGVEAAPEESAAASKKSPIEAIAALTQERIMNSAGKQLTARAEMHRRDHPGQPGEKRSPASR
jgi:ATP-dependent Clp protease protease subunit